MDNPDSKEEKTKDLKHPSKHLLKRETDLDHATQILKKCLDSFDNFSKCAKQHTGDTKI